MVSFGFSAAFWPVSAAIKISGYVRAKPTLNGIRFLIQTAIACQLFVLRKIVNLLVKLWPCGFEKPNLRRICPESERPHSRHDTRFRGSLKMPLFVSSTE